MSLFGELNPKIFPTQVGQYDVGDPELYDLAQQLICHHTRNEWDEYFLTKQYKAQQDAAREYFARLTNWTA